MVYTPKDDKRIDDIISMSEGYANKTIEVQKWNI